MLDTNICSFIMRERPDAVLAKLEQAVTNQHRIVVSAITYSEMRFGAANPRHRPRLQRWSMPSSSAWTPSCPGTPPP
jgi:tRNA(fMet)-specific endonuclease VapC